MAGNSQRRGAVRKTGSKKVASVGSGGQRRKGLEPKGPTPKAEERVSHPAARRARSEAKRQEAQRGAQRLDDLVVGRNPVLEALRAGVPAEQLVVVDLIDLDERVAEAVRLAADLGIPVRERPRRELDRLAGDVPHQGVVLRAKPFGYVGPGEVLTISGARGRAAGAFPSAPLVVALDGITDPHNLGAIARSAAAFGAAGLVVPARRSAGVTPAAWRSSAGAFARLPVAVVPNLAQALADAQDAGFFVVGLAGGTEDTVAGAAAHYRDVPVVLVVGAEGAGLSRLVSERADTLASIPMPGGFESLNASVAAGIALHSFAAARA